MAWGKAGSTTLSVTGTDNKISTGTITPNKFDVVIHHGFPSGADTMRWIRMNNTSTGSNYARRYSSNYGGSDTTQGSQNEINTGVGDGDNFNIVYHCNIVGEEKLLIISCVNSTSSGAGAVPQSNELVGKFVPSSLNDTITEYQYYAQNASNGRNYTAGSNLTALGSDMTPAAAVDPTVQNGAVFEETDTNKHYLLDDGTWTEI